LAPEGAPAWAGDVHQIWDRLESYEDMYADKHYKTLETQEKHKKSAQTAMTIVAALPRELSPEVRKELVEEFARTRFVSRGLVVTYAIHKDEGNPHAHLIISRRSLDENGEFSWVKDRDVCRKSGVKVTRKVWADLTNHILQREGFEARITEKSFADLGINLLPTQHRGWMADKLSGKGIQSRLVFENSEIILENRNLLLERPESILTEMTANKATFTQGDLLRTIQKRIGDDEAYVAQVFEGALQSAIVVGEGMDHPDVRGEIRYTSESYLEKEQQAVALTHHLATHTYRQNITEKQIEKVLGNASVSLSDEQQQAVRGLVGTQQLAALVGWAGTGKTTALKAVSELYQQKGHTVIGMSLAATAAEELGTKAEVKASTLDLWLYRWRAYEKAQEKFLSFDAMVSEGVLKQFQWYKDLKQYERSALTDKHVLLIDEAGMIGTHKWAELQHYAVKAGAKVIAIGDDSQCNPIDAGDFFRELINQASQAGSFYQLKDIRRQSLPWMREASVQLAQLNIQEGLSLYEKHDHLHTLDAETLPTRIAADYVERIKQGKEGAVLASTHKQGALLNRAIRQELKQNGLIAQDDAFTLKGRSFSLGDRLMFLKNDNERLISIANHWGVTSPDHPSIKNGHQGVIREVRPFFENTPDSYVKGKAATRSSDKTAGTTPQQPQIWFVKVEIASNRFAWFNTDQYDHITHAYTLTLQKAQGKTLDFVLVHLSKYMDAMATYVGLTRHKDDVQLYYDQAEFKTFKALGSHLSRLDYKDLVKDYTILPENQEAHQRVQAYKEAVLDTASVLTEGNQRSCPQNGQVDWALYHDLKSHQKHLGREILADFSKHKLYVQQSGLTEEMLQISTGLRARPLSRAEETAFKRVELYSETAQETRTLWNTIKETHSGFQCAQHEQYRDFQILRDQRDVLASEIMANEPLHREFFTVISERFQYGKGVLYKQSAAYEERKKQGGIVFEKSSNVSVNTSLERHNILSHNTNYGKYDINNTANHTNKDTPILIKEQLNNKIKELAFELLGKPTTQTGKEWRYGNKGSVSIQVAGTKQGLYSNFEEGTSGNALKLIQDHLGLDHKQAFKWGAEWLGNEPSSVISSLKKHPKVEQKHPLVEKWQPLFPVSAPAPDLKAEKQLAYMMRGRQEIARFAYKDAEENILGYVVRLEDRQGTKITPTLTYCRNDQGDQQWRWQGFGEDLPLYGLDQLAQKPEARVLVVEGEKTAEAAKGLFPEYAVITWSGGCGSVHKSDWSVLKGRDVILWPDNDKAGHNAVAKIKDILAEHGNEQVHLVNLFDSLADSPALPHKWDLAGCAARGDGIIMRLKTCWLHRIPKLT
jgi:ATP-dependent exoDNAse (exonuclease V) alpha subunit